MAKKWVSQSVHNPYTTRTQVVHTLWHFIGWNVWGLGV